MIVLSVKLNGQHTAYFPNTYSVESNQTTSAHIPLWNQANLVREIRSQYSTVQLSCFPCLLDLVE
jgi:hypothetical protein